MYPFGSGIPQGGPPYNPSMNNSSSVPFGAGRWVDPSQNPYPNSNSYQNQQSSGSVPFGAGRWVDSNQSPRAPYSQQSSQTPYPPQTSQNPYHSQASQTPYPPQSSQTPYPPQSSQTPYPPQSSQTPYPPQSSQTPYPPQSSQTPYPPSNSYSSSTPYTSATSYPSVLPCYPSSQAPYPSGGDTYPPQTTAPYPGRQYQAPQQQQQCPYTPSSTTSSHTSSYHNASPYSASSYPSRSSYKITTYSQSSNAPQPPPHKLTPTVLPASDFDSVKDAHALRKAMRGFGTDEDALINIICRRSNAQRQEIKRQYKTNFGKDLIEDIISETSGNFQKVLVGLLMPIADFYVKELNDSMAGLGTDENVLIEVLCTLSNHEIHTIKDVYRRTYGRDLESELISETSGNFKRLMVSLCAGARDESGHVDPAAAGRDARELLKAGELRFGTDESTFNMVLCQRNFQQLKLVFQQYENLTGHSLEKAIKREFSGDIEEGLLAIYKCVTNKAEFFAQRLHKSMAGIGTDDKQLIRIIITRCEIDMQYIKQAFERLYGKSLRSWVKGDTSGHYKHALYALIGEERSS